MADNTWKQDDIKPPWKIVMSSDHCKNNTVTLKSVSADGDEEKSTYHKVCALTSAPCTEFNCPIKAEESK